MKTNTTFTRTKENDEEGDDNKSIIEQMKETRRDGEKRVSNVMVVKVAPQDHSGWCEGSGLKVFL